MQSKNPTNLFTWEEWLEKYPYFQSQLLSKSLPYCESNSPEWHANRIKGIGGSDTGKIMGVSQYGGQYEVFQEKVNGYHEDISMEYPILRGNALEPVLRIRYAVENPDLNIIYKIPTQYDVGLPHRRVNVDGLIVDSDGVITVIECKSASVWAYLGWSSLHPDSYKTQVYWAMGILGLKQARFIYDIGGNNESFPMAIDEERVRELFTICDSFWVDFILAKVEPKPTASAIKMINKQIKKPTGKIIDIIDNPELLADIMQFDEYRAMEKSAKANKEDFKARIANAIAKEKCDGINIGRFKATYKRKNEFNSEKFQDENPKIALQCQKFDASKLKKIDKNKHAEYSELTGSPTLSVKEK